MKKVFLLFLIMGCIEGAWAQQYKVNLQTYVDYRIDPQDRLDIYIEFTNGERLTVIPSQYGYSNKELNSTAYFKIKQIPRWLVIGRSCDGCIGYMGHQEGWTGIKTARIERRMPIFYCENDLVGQTNLPRFTKVDLKIYPEVSILPPDKNPEAVRILPSDDPFELKATPGFPFHVYNWQYSTDGDTWSPIPNSYGKSHITFTGHELMGAAFDKLYDKQNVFFRLAPCDGFQTPVTTAIPKPSAPRVVSITPIPNTCFGEHNGSVRIQFDRALAQGEQLSLGLQDPPNDMYYNKNNIKNLDANNSFTWEKKLASGSYALVMIGKKNGSATHSDARYHAGAVTITSPEPVQFDNGFKNVSCFGGNDGSITLTASGGVGKYTVRYKKKEDAHYQEQTFSTATAHTIKDLTKGTYQVCLRDGNGCIMKDKNGKEVVKEVIINQPAVPITVDNSQGINPLAFGYTDGSAAVAITGGTPIDGNRYNVVWTNSSGTILTSVSNTTQPFITTLYNIGKGDYTLSITDANYASTPQGAQVGCIAQTTVSLDEPPKLEVMIKEQHFVSCKGMADGQLKAIATGGIPIPRKNYHYEWFMQDAGEWVSLKSKNEATAKRLPRGVYKVKITDDNEISSESEPFHLVEPEKLKVNLTSSPSLCSGSQTGHITATITGGTLPYHLKWSSGNKYTISASTSTLENLLAGNYHLLITDSRGCHTEGAIPVTTPNPLELKDIAVKQPTCAGSFDGSINFTAIGGTPPYTYTWQNTPSKHVIDAGRWQKTASSPNIDYLCAGTYSLLLTDAQNCSLEQKYTLTDPAPLKIDLGPDRTLCADQAWEADARIPDPQATYQWSGPDGFSAQSGVATLINEGTYSVVATDSKGCQASDEISIKRDATAIAAEYTASTHAFVDESLIFINVHDSTPEETEWILPQSPSIQVLNQNKKVLELAFTHAGSYDVGIRATLGACEKTVKKTISILNKDETYNLGTIQATSFIKAFKIGPNPNNGNFTVQVDLAHVAPISLKLIHIPTGTTVDIKKETSSDRYTLSYDLSHYKGTYALVLETAKENRVFKVLVL